MRIKNFETALGIIMLTGMLLLSTKGVERAAMEERVWNETVGGRENGGGSVGEEGTGEETNEEKANQETATGQVVVVDAGHGGNDPGKIGVNGVEEKQVNLSIALKLNALLEEQGITAVMTRESDTGLYEEDDDNKKQSDMAKRCQVIDDAKALLAVSIHQNSYTEESVKGPQVFYHAASQEGKKAAEYLQEALNTGLSVERQRSIKDNNTYYLLRNTSTPTVIAECSFLSNPEEAALIATEEYQEKVAEALLLGILSYINNSTEG